MRRKTSRPPAPLPQREGIDPVRLRLPLDGAWATVRDHLVERLPGGAAAVDAMLREGAFVGADGPVGAATPYAPGTSVWFHRDFPDEVPVPYPIDVRYRDDHILVADKPHFLATTPGAAMSPRPRWPGSATTSGCPRSAPPTGWTG